MSLKSPTEPIVLSAQASTWLEKKLAKNNKRKKLTALEKELLDDSKAFDEMVVSLSD